MFKWPGGPRKTFPETSLKYQFVYLRIRIFKCSCRVLSPTNMADAIAATSMMNTMINPDNLAFLAPCFALAFAAV